MQAALAELLPADVFGAALAVADLSDRLFPEERALLAAAVPRRVRTFSSGRAAARRALAAAGCACADVAIGADGGAPVPPGGWRLSISHTDEIALAVACRSDRAEGIGVDIEPVSDAITALRGYVVRPRDRLPRDAGVAQLTATFSLRESVFKALRGQGATLFDAIGVAWDADRATASVAGADGPLHCTYGQLDGHVLSVCLAGG